jgi:hypothetical protein
MAKPPSRRAGIVLVATLLRVPRYGAAARLATSNSAAAGLRVR